MMCLCRLQRLSSLLFITRPTLSKSFTITHAGQSHISQMVGQGGGERHSIADSRKNKSGLLREQKKRGEREKKETGCLFLQVQRPEMLPADLVTSEGPQSP